ncbi:MAG: prenyltransferase [Pseudomonadota bacterium]
MTPTTTRLVPQTSLRFVAWLQAIRLIAYPMIFLPLLIGQAIAFANGATFHWRFFLYASLFGLLYQAYLLLVNDHADEVIDKTNSQYWLSGGSRVLPEGKLSSDDVLVASRVVLVALTMLIVYLAVVEDRTGMAAALLASVILSWAYHRAPLRLSYRGHGEVLQGLGCGVVLPLIGFYLQTGALRGFPWSMLVPLYLTFHAGNIVTALPDFVSDAAGKKKTYVVRHGQYTARVTVVALLAVAYLSLAFVAPSLPLMSLAICIIPSVLALALTIARRLVVDADVSAFDRCKGFVNAVSASQAWFLCALVGVLFLGAGQ